MKTKYILIQWPESQDVMEQEWFENECSLADNELFGDAAYFVPEKRYNQMKGIREYRFDIRELIQIDDGTINTIKDELRDGTYGDVISYDLTVAVITKTK